MSKLKSKLAGEEPAKTNATKHTFLRWIHLVFSIPILG